MDNGAKAREPSLERLRQLAREERIAVEARDTEALIRVAQLLPAATARALALLPADLGDRSPVIQEIIEIHEAAETFLTEEMTAAMETLKRCAKAGNTLRAYVRPRQFSARNLDSVAG